MRHRPPHPDEIEPRFRRPVRPKVEHRLELEQAAAWQEGLAQARASHQAIHEASRVVIEALEHQNDGCRATARRHLSEAIAAAALARAALSDN